MVGPPRLVPLRAVEGQLCFLDHPELDWLYLAFIAAGFELCLACG